MRSVMRELLELLEFFVSWMPGRTGNALRAAWYRRRVASLGARASLGVGLQISGGTSVRIGNDFGCARLCLVSAGGGGSIAVGNRVNLNTNVALNAGLGGRIVIGDDVVIGPNTVLRASDHVFADRDRPIRDQGHRAGTITIDGDVWLGANVTVAGDVRIGQGAVVAAGAVVVKDVEAYTIVGGVPARFIKKRGE